LNFCVLSIDGEFLLFTIFNFSTYFMKRFLLPFVVFVVFVSSCRRDIESATWNSRAVAPLIKSSMSINDLVGSDVVQKNNDNSIKVVYKEKLYSVTSDSLLKFPDSTYNYGTSLQSLVLSNDSVVYPVTLGKIARDQDAFTEGFILAIKVIRLILKPFQIFQPTI